MKTFRALPVPQDPALLPGFLRDLQRAIEKAAAKDGEYLTKEPARPGPGDLVIGEWTPEITFTTPGDLAVAYSVANGQYVREGRMVTATFQLTTSSFTHTTAAGGLRVPGLPFTASPNYTGSLDFAGITKAGYTNFVSKTISGSSELNFTASGSGVTQSGVTAADMPTAGTVRLVGSITYVTD
jgi:hypothetical protein